MRAQHEDEVCFRCGQPPQEHTYIGRQRYQGQSLLCPTATTWILTPEVDWDKVPFVKCGWCLSHTTQGWKEMVEHLWERHTDEILNEALEKCNEFQLER